MQRMKWPSLLSQKRFSGSHVNNVESDHRATLSEFQRDAEHILYSTAFRRLQGKTQVHPFPVFDYLRTRLTHTIEVAYVGRAIALAAARLLQKNDETIVVEDFGDIAQAACLAHDLGNPPFGHVGEYAIQTWFEENREKNPVIKAVLDEASFKSDFLNFDGNAQGFRIITRLAGRRDSGGLQLTYATIAASAKYPFHSSGHPSGKKKFGFMYADRDSAKSIFEGTGLIKLAEYRYARHPIAYIAEAADDICYLTTDIEDAFRMKHITFTTAEEHLIGICRAGNTLGLYDSLREEEAQDRIAYLRSRAVLALIDSAVDTFVKGIDTILEGKPFHALIENKVYKALVKKIRNVCEAEIYQQERKLETESAGINVIMHLMDSFGTMVTNLSNSSHDKLNVRDAHFYNLLPKDVRRRLDDGTDYERCVALVDYISGMTDRYALDLFNKIAGVSPAIGRM